MTKGAIDWNEVETITRFFASLSFKYMYHAGCLGRVYVCKSVGSEDCSFATESSYPDQPTSIYTKKSGCYFRRMHLKHFAHSEQGCAQRTQNTVRQLAEFKKLNTTR